MFNSMNRLGETHVRKAVIPMDTRVYIVESDRLIRHFIEVSVTSMGYHPILLPALNQLVGEFDGQVPGCIIVGSPGEGAEETVWMASFLQEHPTARPILITVGCKVASAVNAMRQGFSYVLEYPFTYEQFAEAVHVAIEESEARIHAETSRLPATVTRLLTAQEEDIVSLMLNGAATKEIAVRLNLSVRTIHYRKNAIFKKVGANSRSHLMQILTRPATNPGLAEQAPHSASA
jgi:two-component system, LuxR family, response regulator FixJ